MIGTKQRSEQKGTQKDEKQQVRGGKNETTSGGWRENETQWEVWQPVGLKSLKSILFDFSSAASDSRLKRFQITTWAFVACCVGGATSDGVAVTLSPCRRYKLVFQLTRPQHILCLKTDTELTSCLSPSHRLWPTFNGKSQRFVVGYWKLSLWLRCVIVGNSCSESFLSLSLSFSNSHSLFFLTPLKGGVSDSTHWCIFRHRRQGECELSFLWKSREKKNQRLSVECWLRRTDPKLLIALSLLDSMQSYLKLVWGS